MAKPRNFVARSPLLHKGGVHVKSKTGQRVQSRLSVEEAIEEWYNSTENEKNSREKKEKEPKAPFLLDDSESVWSTNIISAVKHEKNHVSLYISAPCCLNCLAFSAIPLSTATSILPILSFAA